MSLADFVIDGFGGYEKAKAVLDNPNTHLLHNVGGLKQRLLEYRRQHNIFEVGDWAFTNNEDFSEEPCQLIEDMGYDFKYETKSGHWGFIVKSFLPKAWRHATDAEIEAGKRLEVG